MSACFFASLLLCDKILIQAVTETSTAGRLIANRDGGSRAEPLAGISFLSRKLNGSEDSKQAGLPFRYRGCMHNCMNEALSNAEKRGGTASFGSSLLWDGLF